MEHSHNIARMALHAAVFVLLSIAIVFFAVKTWSSVQAEVISPIEGNTLVGEEAVQTVSEDEQEAFDPTQEEYYHEYVDPDDEILYADVSVDPEEEYEEYYDEYTENYYKEYYRDYQDGYIED